MSCVQIFETEKSYVLLRYFVVKAKVELASMKKQLHKWRLEEQLHERNQRPMTAEYARRNVAKLEEAIQRWNRQLDKTFLLQNKTDFEHMEEAELEQHLKQLEEIQDWTNILGKVKSETATTCT